MPEIIFILCDTAREENIGAAARALKTMGIKTLRLVSPLCNHLGEKAKALAHGSNDILENAEIFPDLKSARYDISFLIGSAAKKRTVSLNYHPVESLPELIKSKGNTISKVGIAFGGEESGMSNNQLALCDLLSTIPMVYKYPSLNLGQAVMVYATYLSKLTFDNAKKKKLLATDDELSIVKEKAHQIMIDVGVDNQGIIYPRIMERLMTLNKDDINLFHSFCKYYLKKYHGRIK
jgi:tRNA/rRNA methyltransferase